MIATGTSAAALVAIAVAARKCGDRDLERAALRLLRREHGIRLAFARARPAAQQQEASR